MSQFSDILLTLQHVIKQHDDPSDQPRPLADLSVRLPPSLPIPSQAIPKLIHTGELIGHPVMGTSTRLALRQEWIQHKVHTGCFAGEDRVTHVDHAPHILEPLQQRASVTTPAAMEIDEVQETEERTVDMMLGRKRKFEVVVELMMRRIRG